MDPAPRRVIRIDVGPRTVLWTLAAIAAAWLFIQLWPVLILIAVALMIVGGAALVVGAVIGDDAGTLVMLGGAAVGLYGLYLFLT